MPHFGAEFSCTESSGGGHVARVQRGQPVLKLVRSAQEKARKAHQRSGTYSNFQARSYEPSTLLRMPTPPGRCRLRSAFGEVFQRLFTSTAQDLPIQRAQEGVYSLRRGVSQVRFNLCAQSSFNLRLGCAPKSGGLSARLTCRFTFQLVRRTYW
jgi:hypothetical protein